MKRAVLLILSILVAGTAFPDRALKIATINVWSGLTYSGTFRTRTYESKEERSFRYGLLVNALRELDADVLSVNEANMLPGYAKRLARDLDYDYVHAVRYGGVRLGPVGFPINLREGDVILAKKYLNLASVGTRGLRGGYAGNFASFHVKNATQVLAGKITVGEREVLLFNTHWHASEFASGRQLQTLVELFSGGHIDGEELLARVQDAVDGRERRFEEALRTVEYIDELTQLAAENAAVLLMGTLNALPGSAEVKVLQKSGFVDSWEAGRGAGYTRDGIRNTNIIRYFQDETSSEEPRRDRIDYIFYRGEGVRAVSASIALDEATYEIHPSDHFAAVAEIEF